MKILTFIPTTSRVSPKVVERVLSQKGVEFFDLMMTRDNPYPHAFGHVQKNIQLNYEKMKRHALAGQYDKVWVVEEDTIPPDDALAKLLAVDAPVVSGYYIMRHGSYWPNLLKAQQSPEPGTSMDYAEIEKHWGETIPISGGCMGCLLVDISALRGFSFEVGGKWAPDLPFMRYCWQNGFKQMARLDVLCGHEKPDGSILWPDRKMGYRLEVN